MRSSLVALILLAALVGSARADFIVLPNANAGVEGDLAQNTAVQSSPRTLQTVFAASQLSGVALGSSITGLAFRLDDSEGAFPIGTITWTDYAIQLSMSLNAPGSLSNTFADNIAADVVTVRSGPLEFMPGDFPAGGSPNSFGPEIGFTTPYVYTGGDLLITIRHSGNGTETAFLDAQSNSLLNQSIAATSDTATTGDVGFVSGSPITQLTFGPAGPGGSAVPEPSSLVLMGVGGAVLLWRGLRRRRTC